MEYCENEESIHVVSNVKTEKHGSIIRIEGRMGSGIIQNVGSSINVRDFPVPTAFFCTGLKR